MMAKVPKCSVKPKVRGLLRVSHDGVVYYNDEDKLRRSNWSQHEYGDVCVEIVLDVGQVWQAGVDTSKSENYVYLKRKTYGDMQICITWDMFKELFDVPDGELEYDWLSVKEDVYSC